MAQYHLILELFSYVLGFYLAFRKKALFIIYFPLILFFGSIIEGEFYLSFLSQTTLFTTLLLYSALKCGGFYNTNIYAFLLIIYFTLLYLFNSQGIIVSGGYYFSMIWLFISIIIIPNVMTKHDKEEVFYEIYKMSCWVIALFLINSFISTIAGYYPRNFTSGISFGAQFAAGFNIMPIVLFSFLLYNYKKISFLKVSIAFITLVLIFLTVRRGVIFASLTGTIIFLILIWRENKSKILLLTIFISIVFISLTPIYGELLSERITTKFRTQEPTTEEVINLEDQRFSDHIWVYEDLFVNHRYSKMFGYEFFNSAGKYGGGILPYSLHADLPVIVHASGLIGLTLYLLMVFKIFKQSWKHCIDKLDKSIWVFCILTFLIFTLVGRITNTPYAISLFVLLMYPLSNNFTKEET